MSHGQPDLIVAAADRLESHPSARLGSTGAVLLLAILLGALYWSVLRDLAVQWWDDANYSHGFLVPAFSGYLVWRSRRTLRTLPVRGSGAGLAVMAAGIAMLLLGDIAGELFLMRSSLIVIAAGLILFHLGRAWLRALAFPLGFLFFMIPLPATLFYAIAFPLQNVAAQNAVWLLDLIGVPVLRDGNVIHLSQITLGVTEACSGIRSLMSLLALAVGWGYLTLAGPWAIAALAASAVVITIAANAGRVVLTGLVSLWLGPGYAQGFFHAFSGWLIFVSAIACLVAVHALLRLARRRRTAREQARLGGAA
ncbi:MAG TPA: exosortase [Candidatus Methylomirabilis sp.]|nr:exosortase [Candidatus Methylomirabilis sp.]